MEAPRTPPPAPRPACPPQLKVRRKALRLASKIPYHHHPNTPLTPEKNNGGVGIFGLFNQNPTDPARKRLTF
jgi:hypothetical protein